jgi:hypothetical protein
VKDGDVVQAHDLTIAQRRRQHIALGRFVTSFSAQRASKGTGWRAQLAVSSGDLARMRLWHSPLETSLSNDQTRLRCAMSE